MISGNTAAKFYSAELTDTSTTTLGEYDLSLHKRVAKQFLKILIVQL